MVAPVGKSGPFTCFMSCATVISGSSIWAITASMTSPRLCGGMFVAMPTAMPVAPFTSRFGNRAGRTSGSCSYPSKFGAKSTVSSSMSRRISMAIVDRRASVYRYAAGGSPSTEPKLPWPATSGYRSEKSCAIRTRASYTDWSPCGWYFFNTSPTAAAHLRNGRSGRRPDSSIDQRIRRWTGFRPSRTSGSARPTMTDIA